MEVLLYEAAATGTLRDEVRTGLHDLGAQMLANYFGDARPDEPSEDDAAGQAGMLALVEGTQ